MLTILSRYTKSKREVVMQAVSVEYQPPMSIEEKAKANCDSGLLVIKDNAGSAEHLGLTPLAACDKCPNCMCQDYRDVFVMNDKGATVARYTL